jgi:hypothetical protein
MRSPVTIYVSSQRSPGFLSWAIASVTAPGVWWWPFGRRLWNVPTHSRIGVRYDDGYMEYWEARWFRKLGWDGPFPEANLEDWIRGDPEKRWVRTVHLDGICGPLAAKELIRRAMAMRGIWVYDHRGNARIWLLLRLGIPVKNTPGLVKCSEAVVRLLDGNAEAGEHPLLPRGWHQYEADAETPFSVEQALAGLMRTPVRDINGGMWGNG